MSSHQTPLAWLEGQPLQASEQLFAIFGSTSSAGALSAWRRSMILAPTPIWAETPYAEWESVMPYVGLVSAGSEFLDWAAATDSLDWGWLAVSCASQETLAEHLRGLTQVLLPGGKPVFLRFWDGRFMQPILQSAAVDAGQLLPVISRCLINGQSLEIVGNIQRPARVFPWWEVPVALLETMAEAPTDCLVDNVLTWLGEEHPYLCERVDRRVLRRKIARFLERSGRVEAPKAPLLAYLRRELSGR
ncbi:DUF4123 domain-containing protein [Pseudomonas thivervalensis]|uniref:DUF4123 domain-containing protein n=1 Tax=Pseudomonas thivervalensis TaxID=86265 RepID=UPI00069DC7A4|nr:DUF4123 domain-containing protein [Pseudomonas thivervalensis]OAB52634.1 hypothetical protein APS14_01715 [Pseudomonas thivervalensis]SDG24463.1 protein of unknown function [Pseudomonas thivervalensis]